MRIGIASLVLAGIFSAPRLTAQVPENAAADSAKKRISGLKLFSPPSAPLRMLSARPAASPCAVPLLNVLRNGAPPSRMPVIKPAPFHDAMGISVPAPSCDQTGPDQGLFQNK